MSDQCGLCQAVNENYRVIEKNNLIYSVVPIAPLVEGHVMVLPLRHITMKQLSPEEAVNLNSMINRLKGRLVELYPSNHPLILTCDDTMHASIPDHLHYHLVPSEVKLRMLMSTYNPHIPENQRLDLSELEVMATLLRES